ncbi:MAG: fibrillarin-like rRNA/tRNA 2'-O-methyltransferase [archaeon]|jgi:fibrillarin-like pre-rRNA processing protein|nr:fibrillarin-like rRNA/tRNA 2'-O-methyltransferase [archaeon]MDD2478020.1 fibrillarin-like rRNA/tRNA 2'-O-methyltransferase [Candidatus ainarchaeum sp.]MDD3084789.1 fibrillarin-like rRNA/tRNA 2'-O-methyltransferase [Candidatus ainarchaeum sp.]MDD4221349.1 fibrillarin-like rRNA/tRNA 2'-O-methyltransferase [Candidatus ainarchaeum sp.]MDD4662644.1 fibrillarin-like rRNA/tRNA 2'-O-methyltransferase [Candidatus ainarchaeum sp.]
MNKNLIIKDKLIFTKDLNSKKNREWNPFHSKVAAGIRKGIIPNINQDSKILYLGAAEGYTVSFISDLVENGVVYGIDISPYSMQKLVLLSEERENIIPILEDCNLVDEYKDLIKTKVDLIIQDVSQKNQIEILKKNAKLFLKEKGEIILSLKLSAISQKKINIIDRELKDLETDFRIIRKVRLEPFEKKHILVFAQKK